ncbi:MAG: rod shape-determining protein RodA [Gemmatimonadota bacterium]|nr:rod shape-determining protein RodA [Gemmatimonadota bacterium]MDE3172266.1 rod shape-determining protein RodA [Gemmatimonadota bacterium]MDE3215007.1 rod shape-determining protein RodA [Gemmatimonadota bacterium]
MSRGGRIRLDWPLVATAFVLSLYGIAVVYSAGQTDVPTAVAHAYRQQIVWFALGLGAAYLVSRASVRLLEWGTVPAYAATIAVLVLLLFVGRGSGTAAGTKSWLVVGGVRLGQPSELAKITVVMMLAKVLAANKNAPRSLVELWKPGVIVGLPWLLIMLQPDLGTGIVFVGIFFVMLFWTGVRWELLVLLASPVVSLVLAFSTGLWGAWFLLLLALVVWYKPYVWESVFLVGANVVSGVVAPLIWNHLEPYRQARFKAFLDPSSDPLRTGYHVIQSQVAIGSGGWLGKGFTMGTQKRLAFLPEQHTDFIFSVVGEELGFVGVTVALALFGFLFYRTVRVAARASDSYSSLVAFGLLGLWFTHVMENVGMTLNLTPVTGIPLPFFSYGGSFMFSCWLAVGILARISSEGRGGSEGQIAL